MIFTIKVKAILNTKLPRPEVLRERRVFFFLKVPKIRLARADFCWDIQSSIIRIKLDHPNPKTARKKVNFIRYIRKADDDSISVAERQKLSPFIIRKALSLLLLHSHRLLDEQKKFLSLPLGLIWTT